MQLKIKGNHLQVSLRAESRDAKTYVVQSRRRLISITKKRVTKGWTWVSDMIDQRLAEIIGDGIDRG